MNLFRHYGMGFTTKGWQARELLGVKGVRERTNMSSCSVPQVGFSGSWNPKGNTAKYSLTISFYPIKSQQKWGEVSKDIQSRQALSE
jgi:hypothetical protein